MIQRPFLPLLTALLLAGSAWGQFSLTGLKPAGPKYTLRSQGQPLQAGQTLPLADGTPLDAKLYESLISAFIEKLQMTGKLDTAGNFHVADQAAILVTAQQAAAAEQRAQARQPWFPVDAGSFASANAQFLTTTLASDRPATPSFSEIIKEDSYRESFGNASYIEAEVEAKSRGVLKPDNIYQRERLKLWGRFANHTRRLFKGHLIGQAQGSMCAYQAYLELNEEVIYSLTPQAPHDIQLDFRHAEARVKERLVSMTVIAVVVPVTLAVDVALECGISADISIRARGNQPRAAYGLQRVLLYSKPRSPSSNVEGVYANIRVSGYAMTDVRLSKVLDIVDNLPGSVKSLIRKALGFFDPRAGEARVQLDFDLCSVQHEFSTQSSLNYTPPSITPSAYQPGLFALRGVTASKLRGRIMSNPSISVLFDLKVPSGLDLWPPWSPSIQWSRIARIDEVIWSRSGSLYNRSTRVMDAGWNIPLGGGSSSWGASSAN